MIQSILAFIQKHKWLLPVLIAIVTITALLLTLLPAKNFSSGGIWQHDKIGHMLIFGSWTFLVGLFRIVRYTDRPPTLITILLAGVFFGVLIEIMQYVLPVHRDPDILDAVADFVGCMLAYGLLKLILRAKYSENYSY